jgi:serine/threonine-protein kinase
MAHLVAAHLSTPPPRPSINQPNVPPQVDEVIATGMAKDPDQRYATTIELADAARDAITVPMSRIAYAVREVNQGPPPQPVTPAGAWHQPAYPTLAGTQQRPPGWPPGPQPQPADEPYPQVGAPPSPQRQRQRRPGLIAAAIVVFVVTLAAGTAITGYLFRQVSTTSQPSATSQASATSTTISKTAAPTTTTPTAAPPVAQSALQGLLLYPEQLDPVMGSTGMTLAGPKYPTSTYDDTAYVPDKACIPQNSPATATALSGSAWTAVSGQELNDKPGGKWTHRVIQEVELFPSPQDAAAFFTASAQQWPACSNRQFNVLAGQQGIPDNVWTVGPISNTDGVLSDHKTIQPGYWRWQTCQRALTVANNVAIDVIACSENRSDPQSDAGINIVRQIAAKVPIR